MSKKNSDSATAVIAAEGNAEISPEALQWYREAYPSDAETDQPLDQCSQPKAATAALEIAVSKREAGGIKWTRRWLVHSASMKLVSGRKKLTRQPH